MLKKLTIIPVERTIPSSSDVFFTNVFLWSEEWSQYTYPGSQSSVATQHILQVLVLRLFCLPPIDFIGKWKFIKNYLFFQPILQKLHSVRFDCRFSLKLKYYQLHTLYAIPKFENIFAPAYLVCFLMKPWTYFRIGVWWKKLDILYIVTQPLKGSWKSKFDPAWMKNNLFLV